jgi:hypothetical protein
MCSGRKITANLRNVTVRGEKDGKGKGEARRPTVLSMYIIIENIYYSQLSSVVILLQPEPVSHRIIQGNDWVLSPHVLSPCGLPLPSTCLLVTVNEALSYFASTIIYGSVILGENNCNFGGQEPPHHGSKSFTRTQHSFLF